jgi:hypothetical protein
MVRENVFQRVVGWVDHKSQSASSFLSLWHPRRCSIVMRPGRIQGRAPEGGVIRFGRPKSPIRDFSELQDPLNEPSLDLHRPHNSSQLVKTLDSSIVL